MCNSLFDFKLNYLKKEFSVLNFHMLSSKILLTFWSITVFLVLRWKAGFFLYCKYTRLWHILTPTVYLWWGSANNSTHWTEGYRYTQLHTWWKISFLFNRLCIFPCVCVWPVNILAYFPQARMFYLLSFPK